jgi:hypothetical protein
VFVDQDRGKFEDFLFAHFTYVKPSAGDSVPACPG